MSKKYPLKCGDIDESFAREYFEGNRNFREKFILDIGKKYLKEGKSIFVSVGCGFAGEETHLSSMIKKGYLIDSSEQTLKYSKMFSKELQINNFVFLNEDYRDFVLQEGGGVDLIYISSLSEWMHSDVQDGVPRDLCLFVDKNLSLTGRVVCLLYGGNFKQHIIDGESFVSPIKESVEKFGLEIENVEYQFNDCDKKIIVITIKRRTNEG